MSVSIGLPIANAQGFFYQTVPVQSAPQQEQLDAIAMGTLPSNGDAERHLTQEIHLGEDGLVVFDPRTTQTMLYVSRAHMAHFGIGNAPQPQNGQNRQALVLVASSPEAEGVWLAHVITAAPEMLEHIKRQGARLLKDFQGLENAHNTVLQEGATAEIVLQRGITGYGFTFSTNTDTYLQGINHYVSSVDAGGAAFHAGLRAGHRLIALNGRNLTNLSHEVVINLIASFVGDIPGFSLTIMGANALILSSLRRKHRTLPLGTAGGHTQMAHDALSGYAAEDTRERALADFKRAGTTVEKMVDPSEELLGPIAWHNLKPAIETFKKNFKVPKFSPEFDIAKEGREVQDLGHFKNENRVVCVAVCNDVVVVTEWTNNSGSYLLVSQPALRATVNAKITIHGNSFILFVTKKKTFHCEATSSLEANEWVQLLTNPDVSPTKPVGPGAPFQDAGASNNASSAKRRGKGQGGEGGGNSGGTSDAGADAAAAESAAAEAESAAAAEAEAARLKAAEEKAAAEEAAKAAAKAKAKAAADLKAKREAQGAAAAAAYSYSPEKGLDANVSKGMGVDQTDPASPPREESQRHSPSDASTRYGVRARGDVNSPKRKVMTRMDVLNRSTYGNTGDDAADRRNDAVNSNQLPIATEIAVRGRKGSFAFINGYYIVVNRNDSTGRPAYRHMTVQVSYPGHPGEELPLYLYYLESGNGEGWVVGPRLHSTYVLGFVSDTAMRPDMIPTSPWTFPENAGNTSSEQDSNVQILKAS